MTMTNVTLTLIFAIIMGAGQIVLSLASKEIFSAGELSIKAVLLCKWLWLGITIYAGSLIYWIYILSRFDVKYAYPISTTAIFFAALIQGLIARAYPSNSYWLGLALVSAGLAVLSLDARA